MGSNPTPSAVNDEEAMRAALAEARAALAHGDVERHRSFDMVPGVAVAADEPRDHARVDLERGDALRCLHHLLRGEHAFDVRNARASHHAFTP